MEERDSNPRRHSDGEDGRDEIIMELVSLSVRIFQPEMDFLNPPQYFSFVVRDRLI